MFIPPNRLRDNYEATKKGQGSVRLKSSHLLIDSDVAAAIFGEDLNANVIYYADRRTLMIAPKSDELFKKLHKANQHMLKARSAKGDKSIALHELLIDNDIDSTDRDLEYKSLVELKILNVTL